MPELPEVERGRALIERAARGRMITDAVIANDRAVIDEVAPATLRRTLRHRHVEAVHRWGKQIWLELDQPPHLLIHLGMAGDVRVPDVEPIRYESSGKKPLDTDWPPRWCKLRVILDDGGEVAMTDKRRFGRLRLRRDPLYEAPLANLGFDPLHNLPATKTLYDMLRVRRAPIKAVLLDQSFAAGVGNWIADEVLYQAKLDPRRPASTLAREEVAAVRSALKRICTKAVAVDAVKSRLPKSWLFHHRWGRNAEAVTARGERIEHIAVAGRTTAWVPSVQS